MAQQGSGYQARYKRILLKLSGEALMGSEEFGIDPKVLDRMALEVGQLVGIGVQVGLVIGGGNLFRGAALSAAGMDRVTGDHMGMLATVMNALAMRDALERANISAIVMSAISMVGVTDHYDRRKAMRHLVPVIRSSPRIRQLACVQSKSTLTSCSRQPRSMAFTRLIHSKTRMPRSSII
jgi:uridylate kinase